MPDADAAVLARVGRGERAALAELYRRFERPLHRFLLSRLNDPAECADLLHEVFLEVWRVADRFEGRSTVRTWLFGIAWRKAVDVHRRRARLDPGGSEAVPDRVDEAPAGEACLLAAQEAGHVEHCMETLSEDHRAAVRLLFWEDMRVADIAEVLGVPAGTVKSRVHHAKALLLRCLEGRLGQGRGA